MNNELISKLNSIIKRNTKIPIDESNIDENINLINDLEFDSVSVIKLVVEIEREFEIQIEDEYLNIEVISSYKKLKDLILSKLENTNRDNLDGDVI